MIVYVDSTTDKLVQRTHFSTPLTIPLLAASIHSLRQHIKLSPQALACRGSLASHCVNDSQWHYLVFVTYCSLSCTHTHKIDTYSCLNFHDSRDLFSPDYCYKYQIRGRYVSIKPYYCFFFILLAQKKI